MNEILYLGGFFLAIVFAVLAILFFFLFKIPSVHRYFKRNSRKGLVAAQEISAEKNKEQTGPKQLTRQEYNDLTEVITLSQEKTDHIDPERTDYLATKQMHTQPEVQAEQNDKTELL